MVLERDGGGSCRCPQLSLEDMTDVSLLSFPISVLSESQPQNDMVLMSSLQSFRPEGHGLCHLVFTVAQNDHFPVRATHM